MRKTLLYLVILALLGFSVYYFLIKNNSESPFSATEAGFTVKDTSSIGKLYLAAANDESILVARTDSGWIVNNRYKALPSTLNLLLSTLATQAAVYPVTKSAYDNVVKNMSTNGIKVEVYGRDGSKMKVFYVGGSAAKNNGTNMLMDGASTPFVVQVPGFNGYLTSRFTTKLKDWRDRTIFNIPPDEIKSISVQYASKPINSFVLSRENGSLVMKADTNISKNLEVFNTRRANIYVKYFTNVNCEGFLNGLEDMNATLKTAPKQSTIDVTGMHGQRQHIDIYWMALNRRSKNTTVSDADVPDDYDADRLYAVINNERDTVMIQYFVFKNIFRKSYEFFQKDVAPSQLSGPQAQPKNVLINKNH